MGSNRVLPKISTNVRFLLNRVLTRLAPEEADRRAVDLWATPYRRVPGAPAPPGKSFRIGSGMHQLAAWDLGEGPTVLLVHGWNGHAGQMRGLAERLVMDGYSVVAFDQPAHGGSTGDRATLVDFTEAVRSVAWRVRPLHAVIAHSLGATATALALTRDLKVDRAVLMAPPVEMAHYASAFAEAAGFSPDGMLRALRRELGVELDTFDLRRLAPARRTPILVVHDPADNEVPYQHGRALAEMWPDTRLKQVPGKGHRRMLTDLEVIDAVMGFVTQSGEASTRRASVA